MSFGNAPVIAVAALDDMLLWGITVISFAIAALLYTFGLHHSVLMALLIFFVCFLCLLLCWALPCAVCALFVDLDKPCTKCSRFFRFYADCIIASVRQIFRVKVCVSGMELLPQEKFLLVGNHRSSMDPILEMGVFRSFHIGFVAKQELFKIPVLRKIMHKCFCLSLDRDNPRDGVKAIAQAAEIIHSQTASIGVYPEGTRGDGEGLLPFKAGAFKIAQKAVCPVVVVVIRGSEKAVKRAPLRRTKVYMEVIGVINAEEVSKYKTTTQLSDRVRRLMESALAASQI